MPDEIGYAMTIAALTDWTKKSGLCCSVVSAGVIAACGILFYSTSVSTVVTSRILQAVLAAAIAPAI